MANKVTRKFSEYGPYIISAIRGHIDLRNNYKIYKKIYKYYTKEGVTFTGDAETDYNLIINYLYEDFDTN